MDNPVDNLVDNFAKKPKKNLAGIKNSLIFASLNYQTMATVLNTPNVAKAILTFVSVKNIKGTSFVGVKNYTNKEGECSNQTFVVGINYENLLKNDLEKLLNFDLSTLETSIDKEIVQTAYNELVDSLKKRLADEETKAKLLAENDATIVASEAQKAAYTHLAKGLKMQDNHLYIYGLMVRKQVIKAIEYKKRNSAPKTVAKNLIKKAADLRETKYKQFKLGRLEELNIAGITI